MKIKDIGRKGVQTVTPETSLTHAAALMRDYGVGTVPVCENEKLLGILTDRDIVITCAAMNGNIDACKAKDIMKKNPKTVSPDMDLEQAAAIMGEAQVRRLPVVEGDRLIGMLSLGDVALALKDNDKLVAETLREISRPS